MNAPCSLSVFPFGAPIWLRGGQYILSLSLRKREINWRFFFISLTVKLENGWINEWIQRRSKKKKLRFNLLQCHWTSEGQFLSIQLRWSSFQIAHYSFFLAGFSVTSQLKSQPNFHSSVPLHLALLSLGFQWLAQIQISAARNGHPATSLVTRF